MAKYEVKTKVNEASVGDFLNLQEEGQRKADCLKLLEFMREATGEEPKMWGTSIVGFGQYRYKGKSGQTGDWLMAGFSPRKQNLSIMIMPSVELFPELLEKLGKFKNGVSCLYINKLSDIDLGLLREIVVKSYAHMKELSKDTKN